MFLVPKAEGRPCVLVVRGWGHGKIRREGVGVSCTGIVGVGVLFQYRVQYVIFDHTKGHTLTEFQDLVADVFQEGIRRPPAHEHNRVDRCIVHEHGHGGGRTVGVGTYIILRLSKGVFPDYSRVGLECLKDFFLGKLLKFTLKQISADGRFFGSPWV